jgi:small conductance mechanosensitive channel
MQNSGKTHSPRCKKPGAVGLSIFLMYLLFAAFPAAAQDAAPEDASLEPLATALALVDSRREEITQLEASITSAEGTGKVIRKARLASAWGGLLEDGLAFAEKVNEQIDAGVDVGDYKEKALEVLSGQGAVAEQAVELLKPFLQVPTEDLSAAEQAAAYARWFKAIGYLDKALGIHIRSMALAQGLGIDVSAEKAMVLDVLAERAANNSILMQMSSENVEDLQAGATVLPDDVELNAKLQVAKNRVQGMAVSLDSAIVLMETVELDTSVYRAEVLQATGEITTDIFDVSVIVSLLSGWFDGAVARLAESAPAVLLNLFLFFLIFFIARKLADVVQRLVEHSLEKSQLSLSKLLKRMIVSIARNTVMVLGILIALSQIGISLGPLLAGLGVAGFVIGFALQDALSNFASGMMILIYRPFDVSDLVEAGGVFGTVHNMSLVNTTIMTLDNQTIVVPNNKIWGEVIRNVTHQDTRRVDLTFGIGYADDIPLTERVLREIVDAHELILKEPATEIRLHELGDSSVNFIVRAWTRTDYYWDVYWDLMRTVKLRFDAEGISIPFPQRDVHFYPQPAAEVTVSSAEPDQPPPRVQGRAQISDQPDE